MIRRQSNIGIPGYCPGILFWHCVTVYRCTALIFFISAFIAASLLAPSLAQADSDVTDSYAFQSLERPVSALRRREPLISQFINIKSEKLLMRGKVVIRSLRPLYVEVVLSQTSGQPWDILQKISSWVTLPTKDLLWLQSIPEITARNVHLVFSNVHGRFYMEWLSAQRIDISQGWLDQVRARVLDGLGRWSLQWQKGWLSSLPVGEGFWKGVRDLSSEWVTLSGEGGDQLQIQAQKLDMAGMTVNGLMGRLQRLDHINRQRHWQLYSSTVDFILDKLHSHLRSTPAIWQYMQVHLAQQGVDDQMIFSGQARVDKVRLSCQMSDQDQPLWSTLSLNGHAALTHVNLKSTPDGVRLLEIPALTFDLTRQQDGQWQLANSQGVFEHQGGRLKVKSLDLTWPKISSVSRGQVEAVAWPVGQWRLNGSLGGDRASGIDFEGRFTLNSLPGQLRLTGRVTAQEGIAEDAALVRLYQLDLPLWSVQQQNVHTMLHLSRDINTPVQMEIDQLQVEGQTVLNQILMRVINKDTSSLPESSLIAFWQGGDKCGQAWQGGARFSSDMASWWMIDDKDEGMHNGLSQLVSGCSQQVILGESIQ
ncbi:MAG: hypothetical protein HQL54_06540 [Magnetococcales bacterium]|nr:hypothetical protein [Magnetococcales bacterium]